MNAPELRTDDRPVLGSDLHLELRGTRLRAGLVEALREAVRGGRLAAGTRLPSSRSLAADLGTARNTVADAYAELVAEGWLTARQGSGTRVARRADPGDRPPHRPLASLPAPAAPSHNLVTGAPDLASFPRADWLRAYRRALTAAPDEAFGYGDPRGRAELRAALAEYLARVRGVHARPERIVVCAGFAHGLTLLARALRERGVRDAAVESYGLELHAGILAGAGLGTPVLPTDGRGTDVGALGDLADCGAVLMTAAHQFPLGGALPPDRRAAVVDWARASGGVVLEDDYDGEFRYDGKSVGALQGLDPERVVYLGTASKSLAPGLRLAWMVLPEDLVDGVVARGSVHGAPSAPDQLAFAEFLGSGAYDRHVRAMRLRYRRRRDQLVAAVAAHAPATRVGGIAAGLHAVLTLPPGTEETTLRTAARHGLAVEGLSPYRRPTAPPPPAGLVVGYATPSDSAWPGALEALCRVLPA
ncbi:PLP-dependent aminotransferase family protein [Streptomyces sp. NPDC056488]|uniref:MocR-like pyridoxine biosynthesis transcription factor PdxR n=1 Tax=Streptomyces sp. NPDC056488 TaxID=3345836 RepID=UPI0036824D67